MLRNVVEFAPDAIVLIDKSGQIAHINAQTEAMFGYTRQELLGQPVEQLIPHRFRDNHPNLRNSFFANPSRRAMGAGRDLFGLRKDGIEFPIEIGLNPVTTDDEVLVLASIVDITNRKQSEEKELLLMQELRQGVSLLAATSEQIMDSVNQTVVSTQQTAVSISEIASTVRQVKETASSAEEKAKAVTHSVERTQSVATNGSLAVEEILQSMSQIRNQMDAIGESILRLSEQTQTVGEVVSMVSDMAEQGSKAVEIGYQRAQVSGKAIASTSQQQNLGMDQISDAMENIHQASQDNVRGIQQVEKAVHNLRQMG